MFPDDGHPSDTRVLLVPPTRRDGEVTRGLLSRAAHVDCRVCEGLEALAAELKQGAGAVILTEDALADPAVSHMLEVMANQPSWSDVPTLLLTRDRDRSPTAARVLGMLTNVTLLDQPSSTRSLVSAVLAALRGRQRQYQIRDEIIERRGAEEEVRLRERQLQSLADNVPDVLARFDVDLRHIFANRAVTRVYGLSVEQVLGKSFRELGMPASFCELWEDTLRGVFETGGAAGIEFSLPGDEGVRHHAARAIPERGPDGRIESVLAVTQDVTESKAAEAALREADRRKDEFLATLAHELRNPLAPIRTGLQALARAPAHGPHEPRLRDMMERQLGLLVRLIDDLLDISRISSGKVVLRRARVDMCSVIEAAIEGTQPLIEAARHEMQVDLPPEPVWVMGDPSRLAQVVSNLLNNAAKYTTRSGTIVLSLAREGDAAVVRVHDNGAGIPPDMLDRIFDMFSQVDRTLERAQGGLGIGLSLVRRLVEMHGGSVSAESAGLERGSTFTVRLPALQAQATEAAAPRAGAERIKPTRSMRILLVDDNVDAAESLAILLEADGHHTRTEHSGPAAVQAAGDFRPDVVLCDIGLPGMNGHEVAVRIRADRRHASTVLVAVTGWGTEHDKRRSQDAGFDYHLIKPVSMEALDAILCSVG